MTEIYIYVHIYICMYTYIRVRAFIVRINSFVHKLLIPSVVANPDLLLSITAACFMLLLLFYVYAMMTAGGVKDWENVNVQRRKKIYFDF